jgi:DNA-binding transcriptional regulator YdaS (Cro superfamily)
MTSSYPSTQNASIEEMPVVFSTIEGVTKREVKREDILPNYPWEELR